MRAMSPHPGSIFSRDFRDRLVGGPIVKDKVPGKRAPRGKGGGGGGRMIRAGSFCIRLEND